MNFSAYIQEKEATASKEGDKTLLSRDEMEKALGSHTKLLECKYISPRATRAPVSVLEPGDDPTDLGLMFPCHVNMRTSKVLSPDL